MFQLIITRGGDGNEIWDNWAEAISNMGLKEWVTLELANNQIWDNWAQAIIENMKLKEWVTLDLRWNNIWAEMRKKLKEWKKSYRGKWINCRVIV